MDSSIVVAIISMIGIVIVAIIEGSNLRSRKRSERRAERRAEESRLLMRMVSADCKLTKIVAKKVLDMEVNGDVEEAMDAMVEAQGDYNDFLQDTAAHAVTKV